jgi:hypothetical protein
MELNVQMRTPLEELERQQTVIEDRVRGVIHRKITGMYLYGRPGTSKSYTVLSTLNRLGAEFTCHPGHLTPVGLFDLIEENHDRIIVLDDVLSIFNQPIAHQFLLAALGSTYNSTGTRTIKHKTANGLRVIQFTGGIICMSNLALDGHHHAVLAALRDRIYVINYEPTDEQILAMIMKIAESGVGDVSPKNSKMVAVYLAQQCLAKSIRPSIRLFVDKAIKDFDLWDKGQCETHWRDLISSNLEQQLIELQHEVRDLSRAEQTEAERRIALDVFMAFETREQRVSEWNQRTGKSQPAFYRRVKELKADGRLGEKDA